MSNKKARAEEPKIEVVPSQPPPNGRRPMLEIGPATLSVFAQLLSQTDISKAQIVTLLEAHGLTGSGNYRLVLTGANLIPVDDV